jgi:acylphosphatase
MADIQAVANTWILKMILTMVLSRHLDTEQQRMAKKTERLQAIVRGRVQGVSFRFYTRDYATSLDLTGWVINRDDGSVEVVAEGSRPALDRLVEWLRHGPPMARVDDLQYDFLPSTGTFKRFTVEL